jgi:hypothetical protein
VHEDIHPKPSRAIPCVVSQGRTSAPRRQLLKGEWQEWVGSASTVIARERPVQFIKLTANMKADPQDLALQKHALGRWVGEEPRAARCHAVLQQFVVRGDNVVDLGTVLGFLQFEGLLSSAQHIVLEQFITSSGSPASRSAERDAVRFQTRSIQVRQRSQL